MEQTTFTYEAREQMLVIHLPGELDHHNCRNLKRDTDLLLASFMDSSGIGVLLNRYKQMAASRGTVAYYGAGPQVRRILEMGGVSRLIKGYEDRESAIKG